MLIVFFFLFSTFGVFVCNWRWVLHIRTRAVAIFCSFIHPCIYIWYFLFVANNDFGCKIVFNKWPQQTDINIFSITVILYKKKKASERDCMIHVTRSLWCTGSYHLFPGRFCVETHTHLIEMMLSACSELHGCKKMWIEFVVLNGCFGCEREVN